MAPAQQHPTDGDRTGDCADHSLLIEDLRSLIDSQDESPVYPTMEILWNEPISAAAVTFTCGGVLETATVEHLVARNRARRNLILNGALDPLRFSWEPWIWRHTDLMIARKRLELPGQVLRLLVTGGIRSGKTEGSTRRVMANFTWTKDAQVWGVHETETTSQTLQQPRVWRFIPPELRPETGKHRADLTTKFNFKEGTGFGGNKFNMRWQCQDEAGNKFRGGGLWEFRFYKSDISTFQGAEITCAIDDELVPLNIVETIDERLLSRAHDTRNPKFLARIREAVRILEGDGMLPLPLLGAIYHGVHMLSFTPKEKYSPTVADMLDGATVVLEEDADPELLPGKKVPRVKQPPAPHKLVVYLYTSDNPFKGNAEGLKAQLKGKPEEDIRISFYGDVQKNWQVEFVPPFNILHHVMKDRALVPRRGTWRLVIDPARARPWFMGFIVTDTNNRHHVMREWPQAGSQVPAVSCSSMVSQGDPGEWAVSSRLNKINGDPGPAQGLRLGWGFNQYTREIWAVLMELGRWWWGGGKDEGGRMKDENSEYARHKVTIRWERYPDWTLEGAPVPLHEVWIDPRFAATGSAVAEGEKDYIEGIFDAQSEYTIEGPGAGVADRTRRAISRITAAPGKDLDTGDGLIIDALSDYDAATFDPGAVSSLNCPTLRFWKECAAHIWAMGNFSIKPFRDGLDKKDEACKDPRDIPAMFLMTGPKYVAPWVPVPASEVWGGYG